MIKSVFISRMNAASRAYGLPYNQLAFGLRQTQIDLNRKMLSNLTVNEPYSFKAVIDTIRTHAMLRPQRSFEQNGLLASSIVSKDKKPVLTPPRSIVF